MTRPVLTSLLLCLLFLGSRDVQPLSREERDDFLKEQDAAHHTWGHDKDTGGYLRGRMGAYQALAKIF